MPFGICLPVALAAALDAPFGWRGWPAIDAEPGRRDMATSGLFIKPSAVRMAVKASKPLGYGR